MVIVDSYRYTFETPRKRKKWHCLHCSIDSKISAWIGNVTEQSLVWGVLRAAGCNGYYMFTQDENVPSSENYANTQKPLNSIRQVWWMEEVCGITAMLSKPTWLFARHSYEGRMISTTFLLKLAGASEYQMNNRVPWQHSQCATNIYTSHVRKDKNTSDGSNTNLCSDTITEGECCIIVGAETANCVPGLFINDQYNLSAFKIHDYKNIYLFERHVTKNS